MTRQEEIELIQKADLYEKAFNKAVGELVGRLNLTQQEATDAKSKITKRILSECKDELNVLYQIICYPKL